MVAQGGRRQIDVPLNVSGCRSGLARLDDEPQDREANGVPQSAELLRVTVEL